MTIDITQHPQGDVAIIATQGANEAKVGWNESCVEALMDYQVTSLHLTHYELDTWLNTWGTPRENAVPQYHE